MHRLFSYGTKQLPHAGDGTDSHGQATSARTQNVPCRGSFSQAQNVLALEIAVGLLQALDRLDFGGSHALAGIVVLLVGLVFTLGVSNLRLQVVVVLFFEILDSFPVTPLRIRVNVHLDDAVPDRFLDVLNVGPRTSVEHKHDRLLVLRSVVAEFLGNVLLRLVQNLGLQLDVAGRVDAVDVSKGRCYRELIGNGHEILVYLVDFFGLGIQIFNGSVGVVNTIFLSSGNSQFHLEQDSNLGHAFQVILADFDIFLDGFLGQINHVTAKERFAVIFVVPFTGREQAVHPGQERLGTVVRVQNDGYAVLLGHGAHVKGARHGPGNGGPVVRVVQALAAVKLRAARGELNDNGGVVAAGRFQAGVDAAAAHAVDRGNGVT